MLKGPGFLVDYTSFNFIWFFPNRIKVNIFKVYSDNYETEGSFRLTDDGTIFFTKIWKIFINFVILLIHVECW